MTTKSNLVTVELINTEKDCKWRLIWRNEKSEWYGYYSGLLVHRFSNGETWAYATNYWLGTLPTETPFQIIVP